MSQTAAALRAEVPMLRQLPAPLHTLHDAGLTRLHTCPASLPPILSIEVSTVHLPLSGFRPARPITATRFHRMLIGGAAALALLAGHAPCAQAAVSAAEVQALTDLYNATDGANWTLRTNWLVGDPCDNSWARITCNAGGTAVTQVRLYTNNLTGSIASVVLADLPSLQRFDVSSNHLSGSLPALAGLSTLQGIDASNNQLTGSIPALAGLTALTEFGLNRNQLTGPIPALTGLTALQFLDFSTNQLSGPIPSLGGLTALLRFQVYRNQLNGTIPSLAGLASLQWFAAAENQLTGPIPSLGGLTGLTSFSVQVNQLSGPIPPLAGLTALQNFSASDNRLTGSIPPLTGLPNLQTLDLRSNQLTGNLPNLSGLTSIVFLAVSDNRLSGPLPPKPASLIDQGSGPSARLCPNFFTPASMPPTADDLAWNAVARSTPWSTLCTVQPDIPSIPTLGQYALIALMLALLGAGHLALRQRRPRKRQAPT